MTKQQSVVAIILDLAIEPKVLMVKRYPDDRTLPGKWVLPGGKVDKGETLKAALAREVKEEVGLNIFSASLYDRKENDKFVINYFIVVPENVEINLNYRELASFEFMDLYSIRNNDIAPITLEVLGEFPYDCYQEIEKFYAGNFAARSGLPYMNHINEGLAVLNQISANAVVKGAYCLHPILQDNDSLVGIDSLDIYVNKELVLAMEYRRVANSYLSSRGSIVDVDMRPFTTDMWQMLLADKIQNRKDFEIHHKNHSNFDKLQSYFETWLDHLYDISHYEISELKQVCVTYNYKNND